jgi:FixJ family two-component response regulator
MHLARPADARLERAGAAGSPRREGAFASDRFPQRTWRYPLQRPGDEAVSGTALLETIEQALLRYESRRKQYDRAHSLQALVESLTAREYQVFDLMVRGRRNKQIAYQLSTSERTVKAHRHSVMEKLGVSSLAEAVSIAEGLGRL